MSSMYEYRCKACKRHWDDDYGMESEPCPICDAAEVVRVYSVNVDRSAFRPFSAHYNPNLGRRISSESEMKEAMKAASAHASEATGIAHDFATADLRDRDVFGGNKRNGGADAVDETALRSTYDAHSPNSPIRQAVTDMIGD